MTRPDLVPHAVRELEARDRQADWPAADLAAWRAIAALLEQGSVETGLTWEDLMAALAAAEARRIEAVRSAPPEHRQPLEDRLGHVVAIRRTIERSAWRHGHCFPERIAA